MEQQDSNNFKITILGAGSVGKSSITIRFTMGSFTENYLPTLQDIYRKNVVIDKKPAQLEIKDTSGQEDYIVMQDIWIQDSMGIILVYSVIHRESFIQLQETIDKIERIKGKNQIPIVLVANKIDKENREVTEQEGKQKAEQINAVYIETSAKDKINCDEVFINIVQLIRRKENPFPTKQSSEKKKKKKKKFLGICNLI